MSVEELVENLGGLQICSYSSMGALTFTVYDAVMSLEMEVRQIWLKPWTRLKLLYFSLRTICFGSQLISTVITLSLDSNAGSNISACRLLAGFQGLSSQVLMMATQLILLLRVQALYYNKTRLIRFLRVLLILEMITMTIIFVIAVPRIRFGAYCVITSFPVLATGYLALPIVFEFILFVLTMIKFYDAVRDGWSDLLTQFLRDGIWAFALPFVILGVNTFCMAFVQGALSSVAYSWAIAIPGFAGCRLILNLSHLLRPDPGILTGSEGQDLMSSIIFTSVAENAESLNALGTIDEIPATSDPPNSWSS